MTKTCSRRKSSGRRPIFRRISSAHAKLGRACNILSQTRTDGRGKAAAESREPGTYVEARHIRLMYEIGTWRKALPRVSLPSTVSVIAQVWSDAKVTVRRTQAVAPYCEALETAVDAFQSVRSYRICCILVSSERAAKE